MIYGRISIVCRSCDRIIEKSIEVNYLKEVLNLAKCTICEKGAHFGNSVSHSHRRSNKMWKTNVKSVKVKINGAAKKMYVCTSCLKSGLVERA